MQPLNPSSYDARTISLVQRQIVILIHANLCKQRELRQMRNNARVTQCNLPYCQEMKTVVTHMKTCQNEVSCEVMHCKSSRSILNHWNNCTDRQCPVCQPVRQARENCAILNISKLSLD